MGHSVKEYSQMIGFLTRDKTSTVPRSMDHEPRPTVPGPLTMADGGRIPFGVGSVKEVRDYLGGLDKGAIVNRQNIIADTKIDGSTLSKMLKDYGDKNFKFEKPVHALTGVLKNAPTERQTDLGKILYGKDWENLNSQERSNIVNRGFDENTVTAYRKSIIDEPLTKIAKDLGYDTPFNEMSYSDQRRIREIPPLPPGDSALNNAAKLNVDNEMLKLADDPRMIEIFKRGTASKADLLIVKEILGSDVNAPNRLNQFVQAFSGDRPVDGIASKFQKEAKIILDKMPYTSYQRAIDESQAGTQFNEKNLSNTKRDIRKSNLYKDVKLSSLTNIDEATGMTSGARRGTSPYSIFGQIIGKEQNGVTKRTWDGRKSTLEKQLQEALALPDTDTTKKVKIAQARNKFNKVATQFENKLNTEKLRGAKRIRLPRVSLDDPSKTIANWNTFNEKYKDVFNKNFADKKYSFMIPKDLRTIPELRKDVLNPKSPVYKELINTLKQGFNEFDEKKLFKKINNATPKMIKNIMKKIPRIASLEDDGFTNEYGFPLTAGLDSSIGILPEERNFIQKNPITSGLGATTAGTAALAGSKLTKADKLKGARQKIKGVLGKTFRTLGTNVAALPWAASTVYDNIKNKGQNVVDAVVDPWVGSELMFPTLFKENLSKITKNPMIQKALSLGYKIPKTAYTVGSVMNPIGAGILATDAVYKVGKLGYEDQKRFNALSPKMQKEERAEQEKFAQSVEGAAEGGIMGLKKYYDKK